MIFVNINLPSCALNLSVCTLLFCDCIKPTCYIALIMLCHNISWCINIQADILKKICCRKKIIINIKNKVNLCVYKCSFLFGTLFLYLIQKFVSPVIEIKSY